MKKKGFIIAGAILIVAVVAVLVVPRLLPQKSGTAYQTTPVVVGDLTAYVGATGTVRSNQSAVMSWQTTGTVGTVSVNKGDAVKKNDLLVGLDTTSLSQALILAQTDLTTAKTNLDNVMDNSQARANAELALAQAQKAVDDAQKNTRSLQYQRASQETIDIARANLILAEQAVDDAEIAYDRNKNRSETDIQYANALSRLASARQKRDQAQYNLNYAEGLPTTLDIQEVNAKLNQANANLLAAQKSYDRIKDGPNPDDVAAAQARVDSAQAVLNTIRLIAPFDGTVTMVNAHVGDQVSPGIKAIQIDDLSTMLVDVQVSEVDINRVQVDQPVTLTFDAIPNKEYNGKVNEVGLVGAVTTGSVNFTVTVAITDADADIKTGMTAAVNVAVDQVKGALLVPNAAVRVVNGKRVVYILENGSPKAVDLTLGASSNTQSEILNSTLKQGDPIVLNPPAVSTLRMGPGGPGGSNGGGGGGFGGQ